MRNIDAQISTDASVYGYGGCLDGKFQCSGLWDNCVASKPSNYRELFAVILSVESFADVIKDSTVQNLSDNISTVAFINHLSGPSKELSNLAESLWAIASV